MKNVFMIVHELDVDKGGMTTAMLNRSKIFYDSAINADIVTFDYKHNYDDIINKLKMQKKMDKRTKMFNVFNYFMQVSNKKNIKQNKRIYKEIKNRFNNSIEIKESKYISRYFDFYTGEYIAYVRKYNNSDEKIIDFFTQNKRIERYYFSSNKVHMKEMFNVDNKVCYQTFFDHKGYPYISRNINPNNGNVGKTYLLVSNKEFKNNLELCIYYLENLVEDKDINAMICDGPGSFPKMLRTKHENAKKYSVIHVNHHENFDDSGAYKKNEKFIIENADNIDGVIVLTDAQKQDILNEFKVKNIYTISNFITIKEEPQSYQSNKVVGHISRMVPTKRLDLLIEVAEQVVKQDKEIKFEIYGEGPQKNKIKQMIDDKNLNDNVQLLGYTNNPQKCLEDFKLVLSTSQYEGQGLSMIEAMLSKKPVIAFDIKYGPSDFIINGENGFLIENHDIQAMADKILKVVSNDQLAIGMGEKARAKILDLYSTKIIMNKWLDVFSK
ncbi:MAG TPA: glycosyl transferase family 1 [Staphylococcus sp.]|nr:glycosyl transferase family 1 [Staphylococcus sp.]